MQIPKDAVLLREGLRRLIDLGALEPRQGSGTYVAGVDRMELLEVRDRLEPHAARQAAKNHTAIDAAAFTFIHEVNADGLNHRYRAVDVPELDDRADPQLAQASRRQALALADRDRDPRLARSRSTAVGSPPHRSAWR